MKIGLFDSGVGGLTILKRMIERHPNHHYIYYGDSLNLPYGSKTKEELHVLANNNIEFLINHGAELIIVACGTVSSNIDDDFKNKYSVPIIDIVTPASNYINDNEYSKVGIIATQMTINSQAFAKKIRSDIELLPVACPKFVPIIESGAVDTTSADDAIAEYLSSLADVNALLLGCTHYPLLKEKIALFLGADVELIDIGYIIANNLVLSKEEKAKVDVYYSLLNDNIILNTCKILGNFEIKED